MSKASIRPYLLKPGASLSEAFERVSKTGVGFVVDDDDRFMGSITDLTIRAAVLDGVELTEPIDAFVEARSRAVADPAKVQKLLESAPAVPKIEKGRLVGVHTVQQFPKLKRRAPVAVIMAGGRGQRLRPLTDKVPKPLLKIGTSSIIERIIAAIASSGTTDIYLSVNYKAQAFERRLRDGGHLGVRLQYLREKQKLGTAGALSLLPASPGLPVLVTNADILTRLDFARLVEYHNHRRADMTVAGTFHATTIPYGVMRTEGEHLVAVEEKPEIRVLCNAGIYILDPKALKMVKKQEPLDMPELISRVKDRGGRVNVFPIIEKWFDIGSPEDFQKVLMEFATYEEE